MSKLITNTIRHTGGSADNITLDNSQNVTVEGNATVDGNLTATGTTTISGYHPTTSRSNRNLVINGEFQVAQRATSIAASSDMYTVDRFGVSAANHDAGADQAQVALTSSDTGPWAKGHRFAWQLTNGNQTGGAGTSDKMEIYTKLEAQDIANSGWDYNSTSSYITLSFWVKSSVAQNFHGYLLTDDVSTRSYAFETGSLSANTWTKVTKTIPGNANLGFNNDNGLGLTINFCQFLGTGLTGTAGTLNTWVSYTSTQRTPDQTSTWYTTNDATFALTGIQLEVGDTATDYEHLSYADELLRCQRYYYLHADVAGDPICMVHHYQQNNFFGQIYFPVRMRIPPTLDATADTSYFEVYCNGSGTLNSVQLQEESDMGYTINIYGGGNQGSGDVGKAGWAKLNNSSGRIAFKAEL